MTITEAKIILNLETIDPDEVNDHFEELVFQQIQIFLKDPFIPNLVSTRLKKLKDSFSAYSFLVKENQFPRINKPDLKDLQVIVKWKDFFYAYEANKAILRKNISFSYHYDDLENLLNLLTQNEISYCNRLLKVIPQVPKVEAKLSDSIQVIEVLKECENLMNRNLIDHTIVSFSKIPENMVTFNLSKEVNRLRKMDRNGQ
jgi:hypothetical protein